MTPNQIIVLLLCFIGHEVPDEQWAQHASGLLTANGLLAPRPGDSKLCVTEKGRVYIAALDEIKMPVEVTSWVIPG